MTEDDDGLFREEAIEHHIRRRGPGELLRARSPFVDRLYVVFLVLVVIGAAIVVAVLW